MFSFTIGCDPELICKRRGVFVNAEDYFRSRSAFGLDGNSSVAEIRPGFSENPLELAAKIQKIIEYGHEKAPDLEFYAGHYQCNFPIGGHIHFGLEPENRFINALDIVFGSLSECIDDEDQRFQREWTGYGKKGSYRCNDHGEDVFYSGDDEPLCRECFEEYYTYCDNCSDTISRNNIYGGSNDQILCYDCYENETDDIPDNPHVDRKEVSDIIKLSRNFLRC
jgi:hypothetical protein